MNTIPYYNNRFLAMNTRFEAVFWGIDPAVCSQIFSEIENAVHEADLLLSCYNPASETYQLNQSDAGIAVQLSEELFDLMCACSGWHDLTEGSFDVTTHLLVRSGFSKIDFDRTKKTVTFSDDTQTVDFGAIGKGYALQKTAEIIDQSELKHAFISFGESSILTRGHHPHGDWWPFGIIDPHDQENVIHTLKLNDHALSTSNTIQHKNGEHVHHIIDPATGIPVKKQQLISVKSESPVTAEALSTALLIADETRTKRILKKINKTEIIRIDYDDETRISVITN